LAASIKLAFNQISKEFSMARNKKYFIHRLDQMLAGERRLILKTLEDGKIPNFENKVFLFEYIRHLEDIVAENCVGPGVVSNDGLNDWMKARGESTNIYL
jgi:hypothetical protein